MSLLLVSMRHAFLFLYLFISVVPAKMLGDSHPPDAAKKRNLMEFRELLFSYEGDALMQRADKLVWCISNPHHLYAQETVYNICDEIEKKKITPRMKGSLDWLKGWSDRRHSHPAWKPLYMILQKVFSGSLSSNEGISSIKEQFEQTKRDTPGQDPTQMEEEIDRRIDYLLWYLYFMKELAISKLVDTMSKNIKNGYLSDLNIPDSALEEARTLSAHKHTKAKLRYLMLEVFVKRNSAASDEAIKTIMALKDVVAKKLERIKHAPEHEVEEE